MWRTLGVRLKLPVERRKEITRKYTRVRERRERIRGERMCERGRTVVRGARREARG